METIKNYLDNMFAGLPKTARVTDLKNDILTNMEEKYNELKSQGKSENEAIGIVISEFGNIDELVNELGIRNENGDITAPIVNREEVEDYLKVKKKVGLQVGVGVFLCIIAPAILILISSLFRNGMFYKGNVHDVGRELGHVAHSIGNVNDVGGVFGIIALFILVAIAVSIFIFSGMNFERFKYMEQGVQLPSNLKEELKKRYDNDTPKFYIKIIVGVCLIILSPVAIFVAYLVNGIANEAGVIIMLLLVAVSVFLFITTGIIRESYQQLLQIGNYNRKQKKEDKVIGAVASIVWPLAVIIFLVAGIVYDKWEICWIVFPITGLLFGMFSAAYSIITDKQ